MAIQNFPASKRKASAFILYLLLPICLLLGSCQSVSSIYPLSEGKQDLVFSEDLVGVWEEDDDYTVVQKGEDSTYQIMKLMALDTLPVLYDTSHFIGKLVLVDGYQFMDCVANLADSVKRRLGLYTLKALTPTHFIYRVILRNKKEVVELWELDYYKVEEVLIEKKVAFYKDPGDNLILLEPTGNLKKLLVQFIKEQSPVWKKSILIRSRTGPVLARSIR